MNIQPNSENINKYIPKEDYFFLILEQRRMSFIGEYLTGWATEAIEKRIIELEKLEEIGFLYLGEKNWLMSYLESETPESMDSYYKWVVSNFINYLGLNFEIDREYYSSQMKETVWRAELFVSNYLLKYKKLNNPAYNQIEELELFVVGNKEAPSPSHMIVLFEAMHELEYSISTLSNDTNGYEPLDITGIDVTDTLVPSRWRINVISEYGSEFYKTIIQGSGWRES